MVEVVLVSASLQNLYSYLIAEHFSDGFVFPFLQAICFVVFLVGFITVLCIGNYFRAKRAQERQRQRRLAKLTGPSNASVAPGSVAGMSYEAPSHVIPPPGVQA